MEVVDFGYVDFEITVRQVSRDNRRAVVENASLEPEKGPGRRYN